MWQVVRQMRDSGVTVILTTHYIEEAEEMADRIGVITNGEIVVVEEKAELMRKLGKKQLVLRLGSTLATVPEALGSYRLELDADGRALVYTYDTRAARTGITTLLNAARDAGLQVADIETRQSSLEDIFVDLVRQAQ
jgi:ABC-2 type transport system ATP-binding protein